VFETGGVANFETQCTLLEQLQVLLLL